jgi:hypothetical protein
MEKSCSLVYRGEEDPDGSLSNIGNLLKAKANEGVSPSFTICILRQPCSNL